MRSQAVVGLTTSTASERCDQGQGVGGQPLSPQSTVTRPCFIYSFVSFLRVVGAYSVRLSPFPCLHFCFLFAAIYISPGVGGSSRSAHSGRAVSVNCNRHLNPQLRPFDQFVKNISYFLFFNLKTYYSFLHLSLISGNHRHKSERNCRVSSENGNELEIFKKQLFQHTSIFPHCRLPSQCSFIYTFSI